MLAVPGVWVVDGQPLRVGPGACYALVLVLLAPPGACVWHVMEPDRVEQQILPVWYEGTCCSG